MAASDGTGPIGDADLGAVRSRLEALALPAAVIALADGPVAAPTESAIGGPAWRPEGVDWPEWRRKPMLFLAQIDFAEMPALPDFPDRGLLQVFVGDSDTLGCRFPSAAGQGVHLDFWPEPVGGAPVPGPVSRHLPFEDRSIGETGRRVTFARADVLPSLEDWRVVPMLEPLWERPGEETLEMFLDEIHLEHPVHHVGGHPDFTQYDIRSADKHAEYDRTLLKLGCDDAIMWGDGGEAHWLIPAADLRARRFEAALYSWDCT